MNTLKTPNCPDCNRNIWIEFHKSRYCQICEIIMKKQKHPNDKKILG